MIINLFTNENEQNNENKVLDNLLVDKILVVLEASMHDLLLTVEWWPFRFAWPKSSGHMFRACFNLRLA